MHGTCTYSIVLNGTGAEGNGMAASAAVAVAVAVVAAVAAAVWMVYNSIFHPAMQYEWVGLAPCQSSIIL